MFPKEIVYSVTDRCLRESAKVPELRNKLIQGRVPVAEAHSVRYIYTSVHVIVLSLVVCLYWLVSFAYFYSV